MEIIDPGHRYRLRNLDGYGSNILQFVKREGHKYPGNIGQYEGTNMQEVLRVLIDRLKYLDKQDHSDENELCITLLRTCIARLEVRAAIRHKRKIPKECYNTQMIEIKAVCRDCGHIGCKGECNHQ